MRPRRLAWFAAALLVVAADQGAKALILSSFRLNEDWDVVGSFLRLTFIQNTGAAFGIFQGFPLFFTLLTAGAIVIIVVHQLMTEETHALYHVSLALVLGGAAGNLLDRIRHGWVVDFLDVGFGGTRWPAFNLADAAISVGVLILLLSVIRHDPEAEIAGDPEGAEAAELPPHPRIGAD